MRKKYLFLILFFFLIIILCVKKYPSIEEGFSLKLGHIYRPYVRKVRVYSENLYNNVTGNVSTFFRKIGVA
jgi:hypothetical protein